MVNVKVDAKALSIRARGMEKRSKDLTPAFRSIRVYADRQTNRTFHTLRQGGRFRGVTWKWFAPQYRRKTDGALVPAEGGVRKLHGRGLVKGRKRPSGKRITKSSSLMRDTGSLAAQSSRVWRITKISMRGKIRAPHAKKLQEQRPFLFWQVGKDTKYIRDTIGNHIAGRRASLNPAVGGLLATLRSM